MAKLQDKDFEQVSGGGSVKDQKYYEGNLKNINNMLKGLYLELNGGSTHTKEERIRIQNTINRLEDILSKNE